jgi:hypothetical protein
MSNSAQVSFHVYGEVRHAHQSIRECGKVRRRPSAKAPEQPGSFDLGDHRLCFRARDRAASQGHIVVDLDHHTATTEQQHRAQLRVAIDANDDFDAVSGHLLHRGAGDPSLWGYRIVRIYSLPLDGGGHLNRPWHRPGFTRTTPASVLYRISGESSLRATGNPICSAASTAASAEFARCSRALPTPQAANSSLLSDSESVGRRKPSTWAMASSCAAVRDGAAAGTRYPEGGMRGVYF